jgi:hypothetical protein
VFVSADWLSKVGRKKREHHAVAATMPGWVPRSEDTFMDKTDALRDLLGVGVVGISDEVQPLDRKRTKRPLRSQSDGNGCGTASSSFGPKPVTDASDAGIGDERMNVDRSERVTLDLLDREGGAMTWASISAPTAEVRGSAVSARSFVATWVSFPERRSVRVKSL